MKKTIKFKFLKYLFVSLWVVSIVLLKPVYADKGNLHHLNKKEGKNPLNKKAILVTNKNISSPLKLSQPSNTPQALHQSNHLKQGVSNSDKPKKIVWNLHNADIKNVIQQVSQYTGKNFLLGNNITGNITLIAEKPIDQKQLYNVFLSALQVIGLAVVPDGAVIKIVRQSDPSARGLNYPLLNQNKLKPSDQIVIEVIEVVNIPAATISSMLRPLLTSSVSQLITVPGSNYLIAMDTVTALMRLKALIERIDVSSEDIEIMPLHYALASEVANTVNQLLNASGPRSVYGASKTTIAADDRSNSILLSGDKGQRLRVRLIIASLDQKTQGQGNIETIYLKYQKAEDVVEVLKNIIQSYYNQMQGKQGSKVSSSVQNVRPSQSQGGDVTTGTMSSSGGDSAFGSSSDLQSLGTSLSAKVRQVEGAVIGNTSITSEPSLNALIISAPPTLMRLIKQTIRQLDIRRRQILVEAIIAQVDSKFEKDLGVHWSASLGSGRIGFLQPNITKGVSFDNSLAPTAGFNAALQAGNIKVLLSMLQSNGKTNILSTPSVLTLDNVKATIFSGQDVPVPSSSVSAPGYNNNDSGGAFQTQTTFTRVNVGASLSLIPQITMGNTIELQLAVGSTSIVDNNNTVSAAEGGPSFNKQNIKTTVLVNNGDILVLGGLKSRINSGHQDGVPFLSQIPLLGEAFKYNTKTSSEQNLMIFIRPVIIDTQQKSLMVSQNKYEFMQDKFLLNQVKAYHAAQEAVMMPSLKQQPILTLPNPFLFNQADDRRYQEKAYRPKG